jgi:hypothetical protein
MPLTIGRDSIIAAQIIDQFDRLSTKHGVPKKALVIMNYRHAFNNQFYTPDGRQISNVTGFLFKHYGNKVANVLLNSLGLDMRGNQPILQKGIWDASFAANGNKSLGFNYINTPFGKDSFDLWVLKTAFTYQDVFSGYIFYQPIETQKLVVGIPGFLDISFFDEFFRRINLSAITNPNITRHSQEEISKLKNDPDKIEKEVNTKKEMQYQNIDSLVRLRNQWLK